MSKSIIEKQFTWSSLGQLAELRLVRSSYTWVFLVPILAKALSQIEDEFIPLTIFGYTLNVPTELPFSWIAFYFAGILFLGSYVTYLAKSPSIIKDHKTFSSFFDSGKSYRHLVDYSKEIESPFETGYREADLEVDGNQRSRSELSDFFWQLLASANSKHRGWRWVCGGLLYSGFALIIFLITQNTYYVSKVTF